MSFFRRRTKSHYADDKAVADFARVVEQTGILTEQQRVDEAAAIIANNDASAEQIERLGELLSGRPRR
ncbi:hypothetical protein CSIRO_2783 [Bradyrhizobiaceae bacterium SG-6C]|nr:hypothetical protein CSIRO_2783 [Bradyrhizobiaceae bacterium SG-6C]